MILQITLKTNQKKKKMNSAKLLDTKSIYTNLLNFYVLIINYQRNYKNNPIYNCIKGNKIRRNKFNEGGERPVH